MKMDRFTRNYSIAAGMVLLLILVWIFYEDPLVSELNDRLAREAEVTAYPYRFRVQRLQNGAAVLSTPRSSAFPVQRALGVLFPKLATKAQDDPALIAAQQELATIQKRVQEVVMQSGKVKSVRWELDRDWLGEHGIYLSQ